MNTQLRRLLLDLGPLVVFFAAFQFFGIYVATATFMVFTVTGDNIQAVPMTVDDDGQARAFYLLPSS